jgi:hypothetical protein
MLATIHRAVGFDFDGLREFPTYGICFVHNGKPRMPNLFERIAHNPVSGMRQTRIPPTQDHSDLSSEVLLRAIDVSDIRHPNSYGNASWSRVRLRPLDQSGRLRAARELDRHRKKDKKRKMDSLHEIAFWPRFQKSWFGASMNWMELTPNTRPMPTIVVIAVEAAEMQYDSIERSEIS